MSKLIESGEKSLIRDWGEYYFENWIKDTKEFDEFFIKICKLAFTHGDDENRFAFLKRMIRVSANKTGQLSELMAETCQQRGEYLKAYVYSLKANKPYMTVELLKEHIIQDGYKSEEDLFKLRAALEYISFGLIGSAQVCIDKLWDQDDENPFKNLVNAVLLCLEKERLDIYKKIPELYSAMIASDPSVMNYLEKICTVHFKKPLKEPNMLEQMMSSMFS